MSLDKGAIEALYEKFVVPSVQTIGGQTVLVAPKDWVYRDPVELIKPGPTPSVIEVGSLRSIVDYLVANRDGLPLEKLVVHVAGPNMVTVYSDLQERAQNRHAYLRAKSVDLLDNFLDKYLAQDTFIVGLQTRFLPTENRERLRSVVSSIKVEANSVAEDDGITQNVVVKTGVSLTQRADVPNPIELEPFRTFREVTQPVALYAVRVRSNGAEIGLFEADGGAWRLTAVDRIRDWLRIELDKDDKTKGVAILA